MSGEITWGPEIAVEGKRPEWLGGDPKMVWASNRQGDWLDRSINAPFDVWSWDWIGTIRLPADHPHYAAHEPHPAPSGGEVGPEVVGVRDLREARRQDAVLWDRMAIVIREYATGNNDSVIERADGVARSTFAEARAIVALLPEPVDADLVEARELAASLIEHHSPVMAAQIAAGHGDDYAPLKHVLAGMKAGRAHPTTDSRGETE